MSARTSSRRVRERIPKGLGMTSQSSSTNVCVPVEMRSSRMSIDEYRASRELAAGCPKRRSPESLLMIVDLWSAETKLARNRHVEDYSREVLVLYQKRPLGPYCCALLS